VASGILPVLKSIYLCEYHVGYENGMVDLYNIFNAIRPEEYPHIHGHLTLFAQLVNGFGETPFYFDIRASQGDQLIHTTNVNRLTFPDRTTTIQLAMRIERCTFPAPDVYTIELFCDNQWVADTSLLLL
jgi:hypothetical protein